MNTDLLTNTMKNVCQAIEGAIASHLASRISGIYLSELGIETNNRQELGSTGFDITIRFEVITTDKKEEDK
jgi:hypothetical protein